MNIEYDPRRDQHLTRISSWVTGEKLMNISYASISADMLASDAPSHRANPDKVDSNGAAKRDTYQAAIRQDINYFNDWARILNAPAWLQSMTSQRTYVKKGQKVRPIDIPPEIKRAYASYILIRLNRLVQKTAWLLPTIIGFRPVTDFPDYATRKDGITIQDVYASTVWRLTQDYGPWVVLIDLEDAFGRLPHRAVHEGLKALWIPHDDRRRALEALRIRTTTDGQKILKPKSFGVEQGNPLSPMTFNVVMSLVARRLLKVGVHMASYGDDIVLVTDSAKSAEKALEAFVEITSQMGFNNVRPLGDGGKATRIYDTEVEPVPLLKTFWVGQGQIALQKDKETALKEKFHGGESFNAVRETNTWKVTSKYYLEILTLGENRIKTNSLSTGPIPVEDGTVPDRRTDETDGGLN